MTADETRGDVDTVGYRAEGMDHEGPAPWPWKLEDLDGSGTVTLDHLRRTLATLTGRPAIIASVELEAELRAVLELADVEVDLWLSTNMPGDRRVYLYTAAARAMVGL